MEIKRLRLFRTVAETGNLRQAAELSGMSPGALSKSMKELQSELGVKLFTIAGRGLEITEGGRVVYRKSEDVIRGYESLRAAEGRDARAPELRIASFEVFTSYFLSRVARELVDVPLLARELAPGQIEAALIERQVDLGLTYIPMPHERLDLIEIGEFGMGIYGRRGRFKGLPFREVPFAVPVTTVEGSPVGLRTLDGWPAPKVIRNERYRLELLESGLEMARDGLSLIYCPDFVVRLHNRHLADRFKLVGFPLPEGVRAVRHRAFLVKRKADAEGAEARAVARAFRKAIGGLPR